MLVKTKVKTTEARLILMLNGIKLLKSKLTNAKLVGANNEINYYAKQLHNLIRNYTQELNN